MKDGKRIIDNGQLTIDNERKYKKTEIGEIPVDWEVKKLGDLGSTYNGLSGKNKDDFGRGKPFIPYKNIFDNSKIDINYLDYVVIKENENQNKVKYGDIFFTTSSETPEEVGMSSVILDEVDELYLNSFCFGFRLNDFNTLIPEFARYLFRGNEIRKKISRLAQGSTRFNLSKTQLLKIYIPIPPLQEQQKIATILSTVDEYIEQTDALIEKTKELKKGLMQQLLTKGIGHTKFKKTEIGEIPKEWEVKKLGQLAEIVSGGTPDTNQNKFWVNGNIPWATPTDITSNGKYISLTEKNITEEGLNNSSASLLPVGSVLMTSRATIGERSINTVPMATNQGFKSFICNENLLNEFLYYMIDVIAPKLIRLASGSTFLEISKKEVENFKIPVPPLQEQQKIASVLSEVDNQIEEYELKKEKLQILKKGLMQKLLTGKIRVNI